MPSIKLKSVTFDGTPFRKLRDLKIDFAERITIIAGHNGIGKSTILALISNASGYRNKDLPSYFNRAYEGNLNEIVHLDYDREYEQVKAAGNELPSPRIEYQIEGKYQLIKRSAVTGRTERREVRVVARNDPHEPFEVPEGTIKVGQDAKVPMPTLYLGMTRMLPVGESDPTSVMTTVDTSVSEEDVGFIQSFIDSVIPYNNASGAKEVTTQSIKGTKKTTKHPEYAHNTRCISLGQDSLSSIATALASFKKLEREWDEYPGGLAATTSTAAQPAKQCTSTVPSSSSRMLRLAVESLWAGQHAVYLFAPVCRTLVSFSRTVMSDIGSLLDGKGS